MSDLTKQIFLSLLAAHVIGDFVLQTDADIRHKRRFQTLLKHSLIITALSYFLSGFWASWVIPLAIISTHFVLDFLKANLQQRDLKVFVLDQFMHITVIAAVSLILGQGMVSTSPPFWQVLFGRPYYLLLILASGVIVTIFAGAVTVGLGVQPFLEQMESAVQGASSISGQEQGRLDKGFAEGGRVIGQLERALILLLVLVDQPSAVGFLIAAKSILRFGEVREGSNRMQAEYIILGTLMSFLFGLVSAYVTRLALLEF